MNGCELKAKPTEELTIWQISNEREISSLLSEIDTDQSKSISQKEVGAFIANPNIHSWSKCERGAIVNALFENNYIECAPTLFSSANYARDLESTNICLAAVPPTDHLAMDYFLRTTQSLPSLQLKAIEKSEIIFFGLFRHIETEAGQKLAIQKINWDDILNSSDASMGRKINALKNEAKSEKVKALIDNEVTSPRSPTMLDFITKRPNEEEYRKLQPGRHNAKSPIVGNRVKVHEQYSSFAIKHPAQLRFSSALYYDNTNFKPNASKSTRFKMIPLSIRSEADSMSRQIYENYCASSGLDPLTAVEWADDFIFKGVTYTQEASEHFEWKLIATINTGGMTKEHEGKYYYNPAFLVALHELGHIEDRAVGSKEERGLKTYILEIAPTLQDIIRRDAIYKRIHNIPLREEVQYPELVPTSAPDKGINLGLIANTFRELETKHGGIYEALMSQDGQAFIMQFYSNKPMFR